MNDGELVRIKYTKGQMLTARDFNDQQEYHREKQRHLLRRFPPGIIEGLGVECVEKGDDPNDFDGFLISEGLAADPEGNQIIVPENGFKVDVNEFDPDSPYLSLKYSEEEKSVGDGLCETNQKNNRIKEGFNTSWDKSPNLGSNITVALIQLKEGEELGPTCDVYDVILEDTKGGPRIRLDARVIDTDQISDGAITEAKIRDKSVSEIKLSDAVKDKLVTGGNSHNHTNGQGGLIPEAGLVQAVIDKLVTNGNTHDHSGSDGALIPETGLEATVKNKLVSNGNAHDHSGGDGAAIPETGLVQAVKDKLVNNGNTHDHSGGDGALIPETGLVQAVRDKLVTGGDNHTHLGDGAAIPESGLESAVQNKLVTNGNTHDHSGGDGALIPETGLEATVKNKLVSNGNAHDHSGGDGAAIPETGLVQAVKDKLVNNGNTHDHSGGDGALIPETGLALTVKNKLVTNGDTHDHSGGDGAAITSSGLAPGAVTKDKLSLIAVLSSGTLNPLETKPITPPLTSVSQNAIIQVIPITAIKLSWTFSVEFEASNKLTYHLTVKNESNAVGGFQVRAIAFGPDS